LTIAARDRRRSAYARGYTKRWDRAARAFRRQYPLCGMRPPDVETGDPQPPVMSACYDGGLVTAATQTDHVQPHRGDPVLFWDRAHNWQALCGPCGARKSQAGL
jgi:5-methylcytosine-specific restriction protein A